MCIICNFRVPCDRDRFIESAADEATAAAAAAVTPDVAFNAFVREEVVKVEAEPAPIKPELLPEPGEPEMMPVEPIVPDELRIPPVMVGLIQTPFTCVRVYVFSKVQEKGKKE